MKKDLYFYFVRHGKTEWNEARRLQGSGDSPLTNEGINAAKQLGRALSSVPFVAGFSSQLPRAVDTLSHLVGQREIPCFQLSGLSEMAFGRWEGQSISHLMTLTEYQKMITDPALYTAESNGGETYQAVLARSVYAVNHIISQYDNGNILVVSHGTTLRLLLHVLAGGNWSEHRDNCKIQRLDNTSVSVLHYQQTTASDGHFTVIEMNNTRHLIGE